MQATKGYVQESCCLSVSESRGLINFTLVFTWKSRAERQTHIYEHTGTIFISDHAEAIEEHTRLYFDGILMKQFFHMWGQTTFVFFN